MAFSQLTLNYTKTNKSVTSSDSDSIYLLSDLLTLNYLNNTTITFREMCNNLWFLYDFSIGCKVVDRLHLNRVKGYSRWGFYHHRHFVLYYLEFGCLGRVSILLSAIFWLNGYDRFIADFVGESRRRFGSETLMASQERRLTLLLLLFFESARDFAWLLFLHYNRWR